MSDLVKIARARVSDIQKTHWVGCERDHAECLIQRLADEIERLTLALKTANDQAEHFEREWYLLGDERDALLVAMEEVVRISDRKHDAWDAAHALIDAAKSKTRTFAEKLKEQE